jgi:sugar phosphate isomerase/epimerase
LANLSLPTGRQSGQPDSGGGRSGPKLAVNQMTTYRWNFEQDVFGYRRAGVQGVGVWRPKLEEYGVDEGVELVRDAGLSVSSVSWVGGFTGRHGYAFDDAIAEARDTIRCAARLKAECLVVVSGGRAGHTFNHARRLLVQALDELGDEAADQGVRLAVQPMMRLFSRDWTFLDSVDATLSVLDDCRSTDAGMVFDVYHLWREPRLLERIREIAPRVATVQLNDWHREPQSLYDRSLIGDGEIPLADVVQAFLDAGYQGHFEISIWSEELWRSEYDALLAQCCRRFDALVASRV